MFEELIEKIKQELVPDTAPYGFYINGAIQCCIEIIEQTIPQPQDEPDDIGWWWYWDYDDKEWYPMYIHNTGRHTNSDKWIKVIMPEGIT